MTADTDTHDHVNTKKRTTRCHAIVKLTATLCDIDLSSVGWSLSLCKHLLNMLTLFKSNHDTRLISMPMRPETKHRNMFLYRINAQHMLDFACNLPAMSGLQLPSEPDLLARPRQCRLVIPLDPTCARGV